MRIKFYTRDYMDGVWACRVSVSGHGAVTAFHGWRAVALFKAVWTLIRGWDRVSAADEAIARILNK